MRAPTYDPTKGARAMMNWLLELTWSSTNKVPKDLAGFKHAPVKGATTITKAA